MRTLQHHEILSTDNQCELFVCFRDKDGRPVHNDAWNVADWFEEGYYIGADEDGVEPVFDL